MRVPVPVLFAWPVFLTLLVLSAAFGQSGQRAQGERTAVSKAPALSLLHGVPSTLVGAGTLSTAKGTAVVVTRASTKACALADGGTVTLAANTPCVEPTGLYVSGTSETVNAGAVTLPGTKWCVSGDFTPTGISASNGDLVAIFGGGEIFYIRFQAGSGQILDCGFWNGSAGFDGYSVATFADGVRGHFLCTYDGTTVNACINGACHATALSYSRAVTTYSTVLLLNDSTLTGLPVMPGHLADLVIDSSSTKCH
jgi:hypothetical protein